MTLSLDGHSAVFLPQVAPDNDQIVSAGAAKPLIELTNSQDVTFTLIPGGHLGLMSSQKSAEQFWPILFNWLALRSTQL